MAHYLMTLVEGQGDFQNVTHHLIEAASEQMVKYHYHYTLKDWGYNTAQWGDKHSLDSWDSGFAELTSIDELDRREYQVMRKYVNGWHRVADD